MGKPEAIPIIGSGKQMGLLVQRLLRGEISKVIQAVAQG